MCSVSGPIKCRRISFKQLYVLLLYPTPPYAKPKLMPFPNDISPLKESAVLSSVFSAAKQIPKQPVLGSLCSNICMQINLYFLMGAALIHGLWQMPKFYPVLDGRAFGVYLDFSPRALNLCKCLEGASRIEVVGWVVAAHWLLFRCLCLRKQPRNSWTLKRNPHKPVKVEEITIWTRSSTAGSAQVGFYWVKKCPKVGETRWGCPVLPALPGACWGSAPAPAAASSEHGRDELCRCKCATRRSNTAPRRRERVLVVTWSVPWKLSICRCLSQADTLLTVQM